MSVDGETRERSAEPSREEHLNELLQEMERLRHAERLSTARGVGSFMAHELGTPLNVIQAWATMLASGELTGDAVPKNAKRIVDQAEKMTSLLKEMLAVVRRSGPASFVNLLEVATTAVELGNVSAGPRKVRVELDASSERVLVKGEPGKLLQVMLNLVVNGVQATQEGGTVHLATRKGTGPLFDRSGPPEEVTLIQVRDFGCGIPNDSIERIFKPFFTTRGAGEGAGLGLTIANGIVKDYGGRIDVVSEVGKGSLFTVYLPRGAS